MAEHSPSSFSYSSKASSFSSFDGSHGGHHYSQSSKLRCPPHWWRLMVMVDSGGNCTSANWQWMADGDGGWAMTKMAAMLEMGSKGWSDTSSRQHSVCELIEHIIVGILTFGKLVVGWCGHSEPDTAATLWWTTPAWWGTCCKQPKNCPQIFGKRLWSYQRHMLGITLFGWVLTESVPAHRILCYVGVA